jgi:alpha-D-ribose 1-methylphosphonate 5-triphosphate synthase subunit PhnG
MSSSAETPAIETARRRKWMAVLSRASAERLEAGWRALDAPPAYDLLRRPETGMVMVRGRSGHRAEVQSGRDDVRCVVRPAAPWAMAIAGRDRRQAELAAVFDALLQDPATHPP